MKKKTWAVLFACLLIGAGATGASKLVANEVPPYPFNIKTQTVNEVPPYPVVYPDFTTTAA